MPPEHEPEIVPPGTRCVIYTGRLDFEGPDRLDITRQGCDRLIASGKPAPGEVLAPSSALLWPAKRELAAAKTDADRDRVFAAYRLGYLGELRARYMSPRRAEMLTLLDADYVTAVCFCADPRWCHRVPAAQALAAMSRGQAIYLGEVEPVPKPEQQMRILCIR